MKPYVFFVVMLFASSSLVWTASTVVQPTSQTECLPIKRVFDMSCKLKECCAAQCNYFIERGAQFGYTPDNHAVIAESYQLFQQLALGKPDEETLAQQLVGKVFDDPSFSAVYERSLATSVNVIKTEGLSSEKSNLAMVRICATLRKKGDYTLSRCVEKESTVRFQRGTAPSDETQFFLNNKELDKESRRYFAASIIARCVLHNDV